MEANFIASVIISIFMVMLTTSVYYEILRLVWNAMPNFKTKPRRLINIVVIAIFAGHTFSVWAYGFVYWLLVHHFDFGNIAGGLDGSFISYVYFSAATYSSLGFGDVFPEGGLRMIAGVEVLNGLMLIGWSVTFSYIAMQQFWDLHKPKSNKKK